MAFPLPITHPSPLLFSSLFVDFDSQARTYLGIARGNSVLPAFMNVVTNDLDALLRWKNRRTPFTESVH